MCTWLMVAQDLEAARNRLGEQLNLLEAAFARRDVEIQRTKDAEGTLVRHPLHQLPGCLILFWGILEQKVAGL